jgi:primosomal protein N' (replication factor Y)
MNYAEVAVNSPGSRSAFSYAIPPGLSISVGQAVCVPFGSRTVQGIVLQLSEKPAVEETKEIAGIITESPPLSAIQIKLAEWISEHYFAPPFDAAPRI